MPLTVVGPDKIEGSDFSCFEYELLALGRFMCKHILATLLESRLLHARQA
jgi:hypothetical protein